MKLLFGWELIRNRQKPGQNKGEYHKVCKNGHSKPYAGECEICKHERKNDLKVRRWAKRQVARGGI